MEWFVSVIVIFLPHVRSSSEGRFLLASRLGSSVSFWDQLCFFAYFLIKKNMYEAFDYLLDQFTKQISHVPRRTLSRDELNAFFLACFTQLPQINDLLRGSKSALEWYLRMLGILPISKDNFPACNDTLDLLLSDLYDHTKKHFSQLLSAIDDPNQSATARGLTLLMCIPLLSNRSTFDTVSLLRGIGDDHPEQRQAIAHAVLKRLIEFRMAIQLRNWTDLFAFATDKHLIFQSLGLVTTLEDYLRILLHAIRTCSINEQEGTELTTKLDRMVLRQDFVRTY